MSRLLIGCPSYNGQVHHAFAQSLALAMVDLHRRGIAAEPMFVVGRHLPDARNRLVRAAIEGGFDHLLMADCDMSWPPDLPARLLAHDRDVCGVAYQSHRCGEFELAEPRPVEGAAGLLAVRMVGAGLLLLSRRWCEFMSTRFPAGPFQFAHLPDGRFVAEDIVALGCWREAGGQVFVDASCRVHHYGEEAMATTLAEAQHMSAATGVPVPMLRPGLPMPVLRP